MRQTVDGNTVPVSVNIKTSKIGDLLGGSNGGYRFLGRKSTGRSTPRNLAEQIVMREVKANPKAGKLILKELLDQTWSEPGWVKLKQRINGIEIHYLYNEILNAVDDFKFK